MINTEFLTTPKSKRMIARMSLSNSIARYKSNSCVREGADVPCAPPAVSASDALTRLREQGVTIKEWAEDRGFSPALVYSVLSGQRKCLRGQSHRIAKALGLK